MLPHMNLLIKPASGRCNLQCGYCFYCDEMKKRETPAYSMMQADVLRIITQKALEAAGQSCSFGFQGGEPTLAGLDFYKQAIDYQRQFNVNNVPIYNAIQTNGTLIDDEWASFFADNRFLVGLSLDGYESLHDLYREDSAGNGTFKRVMHAVELFKKHNVDFNVLTVVTAQTAKNTKEMYAFFMRQGLANQQYIPCLDPFEEARGNSRYSLTPELYTRFLKNLFDLWYEDRLAGNYVYIRYFENLAGMMLGHPPESCAMAGKCSVQYAIEACGDVFPCDFYMMDAYKIGNIMSDSFQSMDQNRTSLGFIEEAPGRYGQCRTCEWFYFCRNGCKREREFLDTTSDRRINYFCAAYKEFFPYALPRLKKCLTSIRDVH